MHGLTLSPRKKWPRYSRFPSDTTSTPGQLQLACEYCHRYAWSAEEATIPSIRLCMGCHEYNGVETEGTAVLFSFWEQNIEPPW